jgi:uncharacterized membrane protein
MSEIEQPGQPAPRVELGQGPAPGANPATPSATSADGFDFNHPTVISLLYLSSVVLGVTAIVGVVLAYVWKGETHAEWESSHYEYLIRTFWIALIGALVSVLLMIVLVGFLLMFATFVLVVVRCVLSLVNAQKRQPMPNPETWLA